MFWRWHKPILLLPPLRQWAKDAVQDHLAHVHVISGSQPGTVVLSDLVYERFTFVFFNGL